jgi:molybdate transport system substrate-binding protein
MQRLLLLFILALTAPAAAADTPLVAVASNMSHVMQAIATDYSQSRGIQVKLTFGSSGNFSRQIQQGAPFDIFLSAAGKYVEILADKQLLAQQPQPYARGGIGFFIPETSHLNKVNNLTELFLELEFGNYRRIAIANPDYAPYGVAARQALQNGGLWAIEKKKLLVAGNAAQVTQYVLSGGVDAGIIPESFVGLPEIAENGRFIPIPENWHEPITQYLALLRNAGENGRDFYHYLMSEPARGQLRDSGYAVEIED